MMETNAEVSEKHKMQASENQYKLGL